LDDAFLMVVDDSDFIRVAAFPTEESGTIDRSLVLNGSPSGYPSAFQADLMAKPASPFYDSLH
jgi:hypothetical protein